MTLVVPVEAKETSCSITFDVRNRKRGVVLNQRPFLEEERKTSVHAECFSV